MIELIPQAHGLTVIISVLGVCFIFVLRRYFPKLPAALILVVLATVTVAHFKEVETGLILIENVPGGLPSLIMPSAEWGQVYALIPLALTLALISFMEAISVAKAIEEKEKENILNANQELIALGAAIVVGSFFQAFPTTGGFLERL